MGLAALLLVGSGIFVLSKKHCKNHRDRDNIQIRGRCTGRGGFQSEPQPQLQGQISVNVEPPAYINAPAQAAHQDHSDHQTWCNGACNGQCSLAVYTPPGTPGRNPGREDYFHVVDGQLEGVAYGVVDEKRQMAKA